MNFDQKNRIIIDSQIAFSKKEFLKVVHDLQRSMMDSAGIITKEGNVLIELGAGVLPMKLNFPDVKSTDIVEAEHLDGVLDATNLELGDETVDAIFLQNTFHHIPDPSSFFAECTRVLKMGGRIIILDPYFNYISSILYPNLFKSESFDKQGSWIDANLHPMIGANQALSYIVFQRDRKKFETLHPDLKILSGTPHTSGLRYLLSGGINFHKIAPSWAFQFIRSCERQSRIWNMSAIHWVITIEKS